MALTINQTSPVTVVAQGAGGATPTLVLQPGTVVSAQVQNVLAADLVRIAIANLSIDVGTEVPLQAGQNLQLAVSQMLAQQTSLDDNLSGADIRQAAQKSGLFLEASLASGTTPSGSVPDLK